MATRRRNHRRRRDVVDRSPAPRALPLSGDPLPVMEPQARRVVFFDVENGSRVDHIALLIDHLRLEERGPRTRVFAVGNWRVIGLDTARLLARHGADLIHTAPNAGVPDWSDMRIAAAAGVWLGEARPGDRIEIVSDDRAFDAVGDVAAGLGVSFERVSYRLLFERSGDGDRRVDHD